MTNTCITPGSVLRSLRNLMPDRRLENHEAEHIAERQALKLLDLLEQHQPAVNVALVGELPRIEVRVEPNLPVSGFSQWQRGRWLIGVNRDDAPVRRRFTLAHEFKHVLDHPFVDRLYADRRGKTDVRRVEAACDHFAACLLMPRPWVKEAWANRVQDQAALALLFGVSEAAMALRLRRIGLAPERSRWATLERPDPWDAAGGSVGRYFRRDRLQDALVAINWTTVEAPPLVGAGS